MTIQGPSDASVALDVVKAALTKDDGSGRLGGPSPFDPGAIHNYAITDTLDSRRRDLLANVGRVEFDVYLSLGTYGYTTFSEYFAVAQNDLGGSTGTAGSAVRSEISYDWSATCLCAVTVLSVEVLPNQNYPTLLPTLEPSLLPTNEPTQMPTSKPSGTFEPSLGTWFPTPLTTFWPSSKISPRPTTMPTIALVQEPSRPPIAAPTFMSAHSGGKTVNSASLPFELLVAASLFGSLIFF